MIQYKIIPVLQDNYVFVIFDENLKTACVVDPGSANEVHDFLQSRQLKLEAILLTHKHHDHIGGVDELKLVYPKCQIYGSIVNKSHLNFIDHFVKEGDRIHLTLAQFDVFDLPGHTMDHIAFYLPDKDWLFSGDVLFGLGCGRIFEGTVEQAFVSLQKIKALPNKTLIFCTHEYTKTNFEFCKSYFNSQALEKHGMWISNQLQQQLPTVPLALESEIVLNPFLTAKSIEEFTHRRQLRNKW